MFTPTTVNRVRNKRGPRVPVNSSENVTIERGKREKYRMSSPPFPRCSSKVSSYLHFVIRRMLLRSLRLISCRYHCIRCFHHVADRSRRPSPISIVATIAMVSSVLSRTNETPRTFNEYRE